MAEEACLFIGRSYFFSVILRDMHGTADVAYYRSARYVGIYGTVPVSVPISPPTF